MVSFGEAFLCWLKLGYISFGDPALYSTTREFLEHFNLKSLVEKSCRHLRNGTCPDRSSRAAGSVRSVDPVSRGRIRARGASERCAGLKKPLSPFQDKSGPRCASPG